MACLRPGDLFCTDPIGGKGEHVSGLVFVAKLAVEAANGCVGGEQEGDLAFESDCGLGLGQKAGQGAGGGEAGSLIGG